MEVIYDISVLAQAQRNAKARTGVFRVVDNVARGLAASIECRLHFCVAEGINESVDFLAGDPQLRNVNLALSRSARLKLGLYSQIHGLTDRLGAAPSAVMSAPSKALRKSLYMLAEFSARYGSVLQPRDLAAAEIYHSPFHALPRQTRDLSRLKRFLTLYDLIPVLYPNLFESAEQSLFTGILETLRPQDFALCISQSTKNDLCNYRSDLNPQRVFVTSPAASELFYPCTNAATLAETRRKYHIPEGAPYFLSLSTLEPRKNIEQVVKSFSRLVTEQGISDLSLVLVGVEGWDYGRVLDAVRTFELSKDRIILTGYVADEDLAALYSGALGFLYLSLYEGFGLPPLEAMQCGIPVITSNTSSLPEVVGDVGMMFSPSDQDGICQAMLALHGDVALREELSQRSIKRAQLFTWERTVQETIAAYKIAVSN
jgi:glycosyltransferase involved in cell wall biosynthesis